MSANNDHASKPDYERADLVSGEMDGVKTRRALEQLARELRTIPPRGFRAKRLRLATAACTQEPDTNLSSLEASLRVALTGSREASDVYATMAALGREAALDRLERAIIHLTDSAFAQMSRPLA
jgi:glutamyl/glutaminyl-tRNA synthetase